MKMDEYIANRIKCFDENYKIVLDKLNEASVKSGRSIDDITLLAATKTVEVPVINHAYQSGIKVIGENRVQEFLSKEESIKVQVALFAFGIEWISRKKGIDEDKYLLFINNKLEIQHTSDIDFWMDDVNKRIEPNEILAIQIKEEKPKFDPKSLQPYDKVLVRDNVKGDWRCNLFSHLKDTEEFNYQCVSNCWNFCIPYNEETKQLVGTTEEEPEFYNIWE